MEKIDLNIINISETKNKNINENENENENPDREDEIEKENKSSEEEKEINSLPKDEKEKDNKIKAKKKLKINLYKQRGDCKLIKQIMLKNKWTEVYDLKSADLLWSGKPIHDEDFGMALVTKISRIPGMHELCHKKETGYILNKFLEYFPENFKFVPRTFLIPEESKKFVDFYSNRNKGKKKKQLFIAKPSNASQGDGILLIKDIKLIPESNKGHVVQEYIASPLLIDKKKFDLRLYILIASIDPFICFLNEEGLARFATEDYEYPSKKNIKNGYMHLTNYSLNKMNVEKYIYSEETEEINKGTKRTLTSFWKSIEAEGNNKAEIINSIEELLKNLLYSIYPFVKYNQKMWFGEKKARPYQILGIDVMMDSDLNPWLLELNSNPSFCIDHDTDPHGPKIRIKGEPREDLICPVDVFVKERVIEDALIIMKKSTKKAISVGRGEMFNSYKLLIDGEIDQMEEMDLFTKLLEVYGVLSGYKFRGCITNTKFNKIVNYSNILSGNLTTIDSDMIFQRSCGKFMDFYSFIKAVEMLAKKCIGYEDENDKIIAVKKLVDSFEVK